MVYYLTFGKYKQNRVKSRKAQSAHGSSVSQFTRRLSYLLVRQHQQEQGNLILYGNKEFIICTKKGFH